jgi:hypothetical protein
MRILWLACLLGTPLLLAGPRAADINVNSRYTVEGVVIAGEGWRVDVDAKGGTGDRRLLSPGLRRQVLSLVGEKLDPRQLDELARRLLRELHARAVTQRVLRGARPEYVQVLFELKSRPTRFDVSLPKFLFHSGQGWTGAVEGTLTAGQHGFTFGVVRDGDELPSRYTGLVARYENRQLSTSRVGLRFEYASFHEQGDCARQSFQPELRFVLAKPLTLTVGTGFQRLSSPSEAAHTETVGALVATLRYHRRLEGSEVQQELDAGYSLRAATRILASDYAYSRHRVEFRYILTRGRHVLLESAAAGVVDGCAPLFDRFVLGNSSTLRGWNKFDLDPLGGNRMLHNTVEYRYRVFQAFYDTGSVWDRGRPAVPRHGVGVGLHQGSFSLAVAVPVKEGHIEPIFMVGMNY